MMPLMMMIVLLSYSDANDVDDGDDQLTTILDKSSLQISGTAPDAMI